MRLGTIVCTFMLLGAALAALSHSSNTLWPMPTGFSYDPAGPNITVSPCSLTFVINSPDQIYIQEIITLYQLKVFGCPKTDQGKIQVTVNVKNGGQFTALNLTHEKYSLSLPDVSKWTIKADYYVGFLRALETFSQLFNKQDDGTYQVGGFPITITDGPQYIWRALMIDTSRHFLDVDTIKRQIDAMLYIKLNILHWHIVDEDAFPMVVPTVPELSDSGSIGGTFSQQDVLGIISYAQKRGIRVIPEIDTPAHTQSWGRSAKYANITLTCNGIYMGQFDPTLNQTWDVITKVFTYVNNTFNDNYIHFGGDEVTFNCWNTTSINQYMKDNNISNYTELSIDYRQNQKQLFRKNISATKKVIYWANEEIDLPLQDEDVIHWWGDQFNQTRLSGRPNEVILSNYDIVYLDTGFNNFYGNPYGVYKNWRVFYSFDPVIPNANVIGGTTCMWNELGTKHTFDQKVLQKASVLSERLWNTGININGTGQLNNIATRLQAQADRLRARGYKIWPVTVELCEKNMGMCF